MGVGLATSLNDQKASLQDSTHDYILQKCNDTERRFHFGQRSRCRDNPNPIPTPNLGADGVEFALELLNEGLSVGIISQAELGLGSGWV